MEGEGARGYAAADPCGGSWLLLSAVDAHGTDSSPWFLQTPQGPASTLGSHQLPRLSSSSWEEGAEPSMDPIAAAG